MELKDNFTNRYFKPDLVQKQVDMIKEPTATDAMAEGFQRYANLPANNAYAQLDNMTMAGIGDGMKAVANNQRQEQIDPILKMTGQINAQNAYLEAQMQEQQQETMQTQQFVKNQAFSFIELSKATAAGDTGAANNIARGILQSYKSNSGDPIVGDFDHYHDGNIYYTNAETGEKSALSIPLLLNKSGIAPELFGADYGMMMSSYSPGFKGTYENQQEMQRQQLEKGRADIANTEAQTGLYGAKTGKAVQDMQNPPLTETQKTMMQSANKHVEALQQKAITNKVLVETLNEMDGWTDEAIAKGQVGSNLEAIYKRNLAKYYTGDNEAATLAEMAKQVFFNRIKEAGGSNPSTTEFNAVLETIPSVDKNPNAAKKAIARERKNALKQMHRYEQTQKHFYDNNYQVNPYDESFLDNSNEGFNEFAKPYLPKQEPKNTTGKVRVKAPDGTIKEVSPEYVDMLVNTRGGKIVQ